MVEFRSWRMPSEYDPILVLSALNKLAQRWDGDAAWLVTHAFAELPITYDTRIGYTLNDEVSTASIVPMQDMGKFRFDEVHHNVITETHAPPEYAIGRCGPYTIIRTYDCEAPDSEATAAIAFRIPPTDPDMLRGIVPMPPTYSLEYHLKTGIPLGLFRDELVRVRTPIHFRIQVWIQTLCTGTRMYPVYFEYAKKRVHKISTEEFTAYKAMCE